MAHSTPNLIISPSEFFREQVSSAQERRGIQLTDELEFYLVNLLCGFISPAKHPFSPEEDWDWLGTPMALLLKEALEAPESEKAKRFKLLGDISLYLSGYFQDYIHQRNLDIDYIMTLGSGAYQNLANVTRDRTKERSTLYESLANEFPAMVSILADLSDQRFDSPQNPLSLLEVYERWLKGGRDKHRKILEDNGITPVKLSSTPNKN